MKKKYSISYKAIYKFDIPNFDGTYIACETKVYVLGETEKSYYIKFRQNIFNHLIGDEIWVRKRKIFFPKSPINSEDYWFNKL